MYAVAADRLRPDQKISVSQWADARRYLTETASAEAGKWRTSRTPYLREVMDTLSVTHPATEVVLVAGTQLG